MSISTYRFVFWTLFYWRRNNNFFPYCFLPKHVFSCHLNKANRQIQLSFHSVFTRIRRCIKSCCKIYVSYFPNLIFVLNILCNVSVTISPINILFWMSLPHVPAYGINDPQCYSKEPCWYIMKYFYGHRKWYEVCSLIGVVVVMRRVYSVPLIPFRNRCTVLEIFSKPIVWFLHIPIQSINKNALASTR